MEDSLTTIDDTDERLVRRVAAGDRDAFSNLYDRFAPTLLAVAIRILQDASAAEDVIQDVFLYIWEKAASYERQRGRPMGWAVVITRNRAIDRLRSRSRTAKLIERAHGDVTPEVAECEPWADSDRAQHVRGALAVLPVEQRVAIEMAFFAGLSQSEIAEKLRKPLGTVKAHIRRGMLRLRDRLREMQ